MVKGDQVKMDGDRCWILGQMRLKGRVDEFDDSIPHGNSSQNDAIIDSENARAGF
jgi:hypothetical protein